MVVRWFCRIVIGTSLEGVYKSLFFTFVVPIRRGVGVGQQEPKVETLDLQKDSTIFRRTHPFKVLEFWYPEGQAGGRLLAWDPREI